MSRNSRWRSLSWPSPAASSSTNPLIEVSGLRSSCEAVATNSLLSRSSRIRSVASRIVHTVPAPSSRGAAVTSSVRPACSSACSPSRAFSSGGRIAATPVPGTNSGTRTAARGFVRSATPRGSAITRPSPRLRIVVSSVRRSRRTRSVASSSATVIALNAPASSRSSPGPDSCTRTPSSPAARRRAAETSRSSGRRTAPTMALTSASAARTASSPPPPAIASAIRESRRAARRASESRVRWRSASATIALRAASGAEVRRGSLRSTDCRAAARSISARLPRSPRASLRASTAAEANAARARARSGAPALPRAVRTVASSTTPAASSRLAPACRA